MILAQHTPRCPKVPSALFPLAFPSGPTPNSAYKLNTMNFLHEPLDLSKILSHPHFQERRAGLNESPTHSVPCSSPQLPLASPNTPTVWAELNLLTRCPAFHIHVLPQTLIHLYRRTKRDTLW